jgi:hypothetical protein
MSDSARRSVERKSTVTPRIGRYVGNDGNLALVDLGDQRVPVRFGTPWVPEINEPVWVDSIDGALRLTGPTLPKPGSGVVSTITGNTATVLTDFGEHTLTVAPTDPMPTSGDTVGIVWSGPARPWCTLLIDVPDPVQPPPAPGGGGSEVKAAEFRAIDAGSTDRGAPRWWQTQPWSSNTTYGAWFYGSQIKDTIPAGATFVSLEFYVSRVQDQGGSPRFTLHSDPVKAGIPAMSAYVEWDPPNGWQTPPDPAGWFAALKAGGDRYGVGLNQGGYSKFSSLAGDGMSGALRVKWV